VRCADTSFELAIDQFKKVPEEDEVEVGELPVEEYPEQSNGDIPTPGKVKGVSLFTETVSRAVRVENGSVNVVPIVRRSNSTSSCVVKPWSPMLFVIVGLLSKKPKWGAG